MDRKSRSDLRINGIGSSAGGHFHSVQINGKGDINGDLECTDLEINGLGFVRGNVKSNRTRISGKSTIAGNLAGKEVIIDGMSEITGGLSGDNIENRGMLKVSKDCGSEKFTSHGGFTIGGLLNAGSIEINIYGPCKAKEVGGEKIQVRDGGTFGIGKFIGSLFQGWPLKTTLTADTIEGDDIYLECTTAKIVRGGNVKIGKGCQIDLVEYKNTFQKDGFSDIRINETRKL